MSAVQALIQGTTPGTPVAPIPTERRLFIWGTDDDHVLFASLIKQVDAFQELDRSFEPVCRT